jgi:hypothetical protein
MVAVLAAAVLVLGSAGGYFAWAGRPGPPAAGQLPAPPSPAPPDEGPGAGGAAGPRDDGEPKEFEPALLKMKPLETGPRDADLYKLLKERFNAALAEVQAAHQRVVAGQIGVEGLFDATARLKHAGLEVFDDPKERIKLLEQFVELAKEVERITDLRQQAGRATVEEVQRVRYFRLDAEIALLRLKKENSK